jgi:glycerol-3-phosphate dehydrogenase
MPTIARAAAVAAAVSTPVDVAVIGGGITGAGVALEAAARGYRVVLLEQADFAGGTSSRSTKLVHGGIRYLAQGQVGLVRESLQQRSELLRAAPHLVRPLPFVIPLYRGLRRPLGLKLPGWLRPLTPLGVKAGLRLYDGLARAPALRHRTLSAAEAMARVPDMRADALAAAFLYYDAQTDDVRLTHAVLATARRLGALTLNYVPVRGLLRDGSRVAGVKFEDRLTGRVHEMRARHVVNAAGVWAERVAAMDAPPEFRITAGKGIHLVLRPGAVSLNAALVIPQTDDGRLAFLVPWIGGRVILGTTDDHYEGPLESPTAQPHEVAYLLDHANRYLNRQLSRTDVAGVFAGLRPLIASREGPSAALSREHAVTESPGGLVSIIGGKLTSFRRMARDVMDRLSAPHRGTGYQISAEFVPGTDFGHLPHDQQQYLIDHYADMAPAIVAVGAEQPEALRPFLDDLPICPAEVIHACRAEMAVSLADVMILRTRFSLLCNDGGRAAVDGVAAVMGRELGWDDAERQRQREDWERAVDQDRAGLNTSQT